MVVVRIQAQTQPSFIFTAAGDYSSNSKRTTPVLAGMNPAVSGADFNIALGDLSYGKLKPETAWCDYVKGLAGENFPFELAPGNHEDDGPAGNNIDNFELCLPHRATSSVVGRYSREYYYDYPESSPLARFIMVSPQMIFNDEGQYDYSPESVHYNFVADAIDSARAAGIRWIVVSMHVNCITMGKKPCGMGEDLFNLLIDRKVDLVLQGHDHNYQRSKQLALGPNCGAVVRNTYNPDCVVDDGTDNQYLKGAGTVINIVGTGGIGNYDINEADIEAPYFAAWNGVNSDPTTGYLKAVVSESQMTVVYVPMFGPSFTDGYTIEDTSSPTETPIPTPTPTTDPNITPTETPIPSLTLTPSETPIPTNTPTQTPTPLVSPTPQVTTLNPVADAFVNQNYPDNNFGSNTSLKAVLSPVKNSYLKFDLAALADLTIQSAVLRIYINNGSNSVQSVRLTDQGWGESVLTYNTQPVWGATVATFTGSASNSWQEIDVTSGAAGYAGQTFSLVIDNGGSDALDFKSRENSTNQPELVVSYN